MAPESERAKCGKQMTWLTPETGAIYCNEDAGHAGDCAYTFTQITPPIPTLTCSEVVERLQSCAYIEHYKDGSMEAFLDKEFAAKVLHSWRERRVQELENLLTKHSGCSHCNDSASGITSANDSTEIRKGTNMAVTVAEWKARYVQAIIDGSGASQEEAEDCYEACEQPIDLTDDPEDSAMTEMSYWDE